MTTSIPLAVSEYYATVKHFSARNCRRMADSAFLCEQITKVIAKSIVADDGISAIIRYFGLSVTPRDPEKLFSSVAEELFIESDPRKKANFDLGDLALNLVIHLTSQEFTYPDSADTVIMAEPILFCYGKVEEWYLDLLRRAKGI